MRNDAESDSNQLILLLCAFCDCQTITQMVLPHWQAAVEGQGAQVVQVSMLTMCTPSHMVWYRI